MFSIKFVIMKYTLGKEERLKSRKLIEETLWFDRSPFGDPTRDNSEEKE